MAKRDTSAANDTDLQRSKRDASASQGETDTVDNEGRGARNTVFNIRLSREELAALEQAASEFGISIAEYVRKSVALRPTISVLTKPQIDLSVGMPYFQYGTLATWSEADVGPIKFVY